MFSIINHANNIQFYKRRCSHQQYQNHDCSYFYKSYLFMCFYKSTIPIPNKVVNHKNAVSLEEKLKNQKSVSEPVNNNKACKENRIFNRAKLKMKTMLTTSKKIKRELKVEEREPKYFKNRAATEVTAVWDFGGTWSSELAGVRFDMDAHSTVGMDKNMPVKILDRASGAKSNGFMNNGWMAKANVQFGSSGPVSLFAMNRQEKMVAVFVGFVHSENNKDYVTGLWSMGKNCKSNLDVHQSVFNIPDVLRRDGV